MSYQCYQIKQIPDLSLNKYQSLSDTGVDGLLKRHESFLRQWHGICTESHTSIHLLYVYNPAEQFGSRLQLFFIIQGNDGALNQIEPLLSVSPLSQFFSMVPCQMETLKFHSGATLIKRECVSEISNPLNGRLEWLHYVPSWDMNSNSRQFNLMQTLETVGEAYSPSRPCAFRVDLFPESNTQAIHSEFDPVLKTLRGENEVRLLNTSGSIKNDKSAQEICCEYEDWLTSVDTTPFFRVNIYSFADSSFLAKIILNSSGAEAIDKGDFYINDLLPDPSGDFNLLSRLGEEPQMYCEYKDFDYVASKTWPTTYLLKEAVAFFRFPVLYDGEVLNIPKESAPKPVKGGLFLGLDSNGRPVYYDYKALSRHAFFTGMPGSGKTNTMLHLIEELHKKKIPFLALEPAKKEYRFLLGKEEMTDVYLFSPHLMSHFPLKMNPMEFPVGVRLSDHINALLEVFEGSYRLEGATYKFLSNSIEQAYLHLGWEIEDINDGAKDKPIPCLKDVFDNLAIEINKSSYDSEFKGNARAFLQVRLGRLMERDAGDVFNVYSSTIMPEDWLDISAIVELESLGEHAKNFFVLLVCHYILETLRLRPKAAVEQGQPLRHVLFIEEAHNIIASSSQQEQSDSVDPKISATAYIVKMLAEVRALGESLVIADQLPSSLTSEVTKNTGLKIIHRLTSSDDREQIGMTISASPLQIERMASLTSGQAYIHHEQVIKAFEIQIQKWEEPKVTFDISNDSELYLYLAQTLNVQKSVRVALGEWSSTVLEQLDKKIKVLASKRDKEPGEAKDIYDSLNRFFRKVLKQFAYYKSIWLPEGTNAPEIEMELEDLQSVFAGQQREVQSIMEG